MGSWDTAPRRGTTPCQHLVSSPVTRCECRTPALRGLHTGKIRLYPPCCKLSTPQQSSLRKVSERWWPGSARARHRSSHALLPPALGCQLGVPAQGVAVGTVLREEAPGSVGDVGGTPGAAPRLAGLLGSARLGVAVNALLHGPGALLSLAQAPAQGWAREKAVRAAQNHVKQTNPQ